MERVLLIWGCWVVVRLESEVNALRLIVDDHPENGLIELTMTDGNRSMGRLIMYNTLQRSADPRARLANELQALFSAWESTCGCIPADYKDELIGAIFQ